MPAWQSVQDLLPASEVNFPAGHPLQAAAPVALEAVPAQQGRQAAALSAPAKGL